MSVNGQAFGGIGFFTLFMFGAVFGATKFIKENTLLLAGVTMFITFFGLWIIIAFARARDAVRVRKLVSPDDTILYSSELGTDYTWKVWNTHGDNTVFHPPCPTVTEDMCIDKFADICKKSNSNSDTPATPDTPDTPDTEPYMLRPLPLDEPAQGKPSGCNL